MAQQYADEGAPLAASPEPLSRPTTLHPQKSIHPGLRPSLVNIPVTPGIHLGVYEPDSASEDASYFTQDPSHFTMASCPSEAASGAKSDRDVLRRMSLQSGLRTGEPAEEVDPRAANPALNLSGGIISATFCIPHSLQYRKGAEWVSVFILRRHSDSNMVPVVGLAARNLCPLRFFCISCFR